MGLLDVVNIVFDNILLCVAAFLCLLLELIQNQKLGHDRSSQLRLLTIDKDYEGWIPSTPRKGEKWKV